tara:strand:- start:770 stop:973 length:204 start_codon:yes stop_codon:yes gene_type:complete
MIKVDGHPNLYRDTKTGAIVNVDDIAYKKRLCAIERSENKENELKSMREEIDELKFLLKQLLQNNTN